MTEAQFIEGTREEIQEQLQSFPKEQRFRLIPLLRPRDIEEIVQKDADVEEPSLAELFAGRVGRFHFGEANLSQDSGKKFAALMAEKKRRGRL